MQIIHDYTAFVQIQTPLPLSSQAYCPLMRQLLLVHTDLLPFPFWLHSTACGILAPQPGIEPRPWQCKHWIQPLDQQGIPQIHFIFSIYSVLYMGGL